MIDNEVELNTRSVYRWTIGRLVDSCAPHHPPDLPRLSPFPRQLSATGEFRTPPAQKPPNANAFGVHASPNTSGIRDSLDGSTRLAEPKSFTAGTVCAFETCPTPQVVELSHRSRNGDGEAALLAIDFDMKFGLPEESDDEEFTSFQLSYASDEEDEVLSEAETSAPLHSTSRLSPIDDLAVPSSACHL